MPHTNIIVSDDTNPVRIFEGWKAVPRSYRMRGSWTLDYRTVKKGEQSAANVVITIARKSDTLGNEFEVERSFKLYHHSQTRPTRKTPLNMARRDFFKYFGEFSDRSRLIRWTKGEYRFDEDGEKWWDASADVWGWKSFKESFGLQSVIDQTTGRDIYGVFGAESSFYLLIDLDLHKKPLDLFLRRLEVLLNRFHGIQGDCCCHFQVADRNAGGVHMILFFGIERSLKNRIKWITRILHDLDKQHPECEFFKKGRKKDKLNIEIYPCNNAHRLPLSRGRTMLLDKPLQMLERRRKRVQDIVGYVKWLENPNRSYMSKDDVLWFILDRLDLSCAKWSDGTVTNENSATKKTAATNQTPKKSRSLKNRTRPALVGFWEKGDEGHFPHLNAAVFTTLQALHAEGLTEDDAVGVVMKYVDELPNDELSSRLGSGISLIERDVIRDAKKLWDLSVNQKWQAVVEHWGRLGFQVSDKTTWDVRSEKLDVVVDCEEIQFTTEERQLLIDQMAPLMVGKKQALKPEKQEEVCKAVAYFLRYVRCCDREIPQSALPLILSGFDLKVKNHDKQRELLTLLVKSEWLYIRAAYYHPIKHGGKGKTGRATAYGIGKAMSGRFSSSYIPNKENRSYRLSPTFCGATEFDVELPSFDEQAGMILAEAGIVHVRHDCGKPSPAERP